MTKFSDIRIFSDLTIDAAGLSEKTNAIPFHAYPAYSGGKLYINGWDLPVILNLATTRIRENAPVLKQHDPSKRLGDITNFVLASDHIDVDGILTNVNSFFLKEIIDTHKLGSKWQISIGMGGQQIDPQNVRIVTQGQALLINDVRQSGPFYEVNHVEIAEFSIVSTGGDRDNPNYVTIEANGLKSNEPQRKENVMKKSLTQFILENNLAQQWIEPGKQEGIKQLYAQYEKEYMESQKSEPHPPNPSTGTPEPVTNPPATPQNTEPPQSTPEPTAPVTPSLPQEPQPQTPPQDNPPAPPTIEAHGRTYFPTPAAQFGTAGPINGGSRPSIGRTIEASMLLDNGIDGKEAEKIGYTQAEINEAMNPSNRNISLHGLCYRTLEAAGRSIPGGSVSNATLVERAIEAIPPRTINAAGFSTINMPGILGNVARKTLEANYQRRAGVGISLSRRKTLTDFKAVSSHRMTMNGSYQEVGPGKEFPTAKLGEESWTLAVKKSGLLIELTFEDMVNDDLDAFLDIPARLGAEYADYFEYKWWVKFLSGRDTHFSVANKNLITNALGIPGLDAASAKLRAMKSTEGRYMAIAGKHLLVPPSLEATANSLYTATMVNETTATGRPSPNTNTHAGKYSPIVSPYLSSEFSFKIKDQTYSGSDTGWFTIADPTIIPLMQVGFLDGKEMPTISQGEVRYETLGMYWRSWGAFGIEWFDPQHGGVYASGSAA